LRLQVRNLLVTRRMNVERRVRLDRLRLVNRDRPWSLTPLLLGPVLPPPRRIMFDRHQVGSVVLRRMDEHTPQLHTKS
jgi:hypothetical protein